MTERDGLQEWLYLESYSDTPVYNTKAVVQQTGVPAPTLRAWERRYALLSPERAGNAYRLYSERDIALIRWLKEHVEDGLSISQAIALFKHYNEAYQKTPSAQEQPASQSLKKPATLNGPLLPLTIAYAPALVGQDETLPLVSNGSIKTLVQEQALSLSQDKPDHNTLMQDLNGMQDRLIDSFQCMDEAEANMVLGMLLTVYSVEQVCLKIVTPTLWHIGQYWAEGKVTVSVEHFASNFFRALLTNLFHITASPCKGPLAIICYAPGEPHELASLMLALFLRRQGVRVAYLGQGIETMDLMRTIRQLSPALICVSLTMPTYLSPFISLARHIERSCPHPPALAFGGQGFYGYEKIIPQIPGEYFSGDLREITNHLCHLVEQYQGQ